MKIRRDFVTNSSSSSFILAFKSKEDVEKCLIKGFSNYDMYSLQKVYNDIQEAEEVNKEELLEMIREYEIDMKFWNMYWDYIDNTPKHKRLDRQSWENLPENQEMFNKKIEPILKDIRQKLEENKFIVELSYSDHDNAELEHEIMPNFENTIFIFNNH